MSLPHRPLQTNYPFRLRVVLLWLLGAVIMVALLVYIAYQARFLLIGPEVILAEHTTGAVTERTVTINGHAQNIARLALNGRQIFTDPEGSFSELVVLSEGYNIITITAVDRYGRTTAVEQEYVFTPTI